MLIVHAFEHAGEIVDMIMPAGTRAIVMIGIEECALCDEDLAVAYAGELFEISAGSVAKVGDQGHVESVGDRDAAFAEFGYFRAGQFEVFLFEFLSALDDSIA